MKRMLWAVGCGVVIALILGIKGFLSAEHYLMPIRDRLSFVKVWVGYHVGNGEDYSRPFGVGWRMDFQYRINNDGCRECPLIVTADLLGRVRGLYGTYSSSEKTEIPHEVIDAIRINFDNQGETACNDKVGPDDVDVEKEKARYRAYFQKIVFALETGSFFDVEVKEKDPWGRALIVEHCESGTTYRSQGLSVEYARDDIVVRSSESSIHASFRYHDANGSCDIFFD